MADNGRNLVKQALNFGDYAGVMKDAFREYQAQPRNPLALLSAMFSPMTAAGRKAGDVTLEHTGSPTLAAAADTWTQFGAPGGVSAIKSAGKNAAFFIHSGMLGAGPLSYLSGFAPSVVKQKGGNWLTGSVDDALKPLMRDTALDPRQQSFRNAYLTPEMAAQIDAASGVPIQETINNWINGPLRNYVMRDMATPDDPVRLLADQGILHVDQPRFDLDMLRGGQLMHVGAGGNPASYSRPSSPLARQWENASDAAITAYLPEDMGETTLKQNPWISKVSPETIIYGDSGGGRGRMAENLGFSHIVDELSNSLSEDLLPKHLRLTPDQLKQMGMEKAVRHVDKINKYRAELEAAKNVEMLQGIPTIREYAENNPKGLRWVELAAPKLDKSKLPEGYVVREINPTGNRSFFAGVNANNPDFYYGHGSTPEDVLKSFWDGSPGNPYPATKEKEALRQQLSEQLKYEGDTMGHCVGGYCDKVLSGDTRIFSLRDAKGEPHVTVEVDPGRAKTAKEATKAFYEKYRYWPSQDALEKFVSLPEYSHLSAEPIPAIPSIVQIKGKQNAKPKDEYLPFVQDFVRNNPLGGDWADVGDLGNTGLRKHGNVFYLPEELDNLIQTRGQWKFEDSPDWETLPQLIERYRPQYADRYADPAELEKDLTEHFLSKAGKSAGGEQLLDTDYFRLGPVIKKASGGLVEAIEGLW